MTADNLRPLLDSEVDTARFWRLAQDLARATVPDDILDVVRLGRMTALCKPNGGVRGIVAGGIVRRFVAKTISQQISEAVEQATSPFQYALSTKSGGECIAHSLQGLTDLDPRATVLSIDGIGAFDLISRGAMLDGLRSVAGGDSVLPFVVQFYGNPSSYLWDDDDGETHEIRQGEGGETGRSSNAHVVCYQVLRSVQSRLRPHERLLAFDDDVYAVAQPERIVAVHRILGEELWQHSRIRINAGKTQIWNRGGHVPSGYETLLNEARAINPHAEVWFGGSDRPSEERGIRVLGTPFGTGVRQVAVGCHRGRSPVVASVNPSSAGRAVSVAFPVVLRFITGDILFTGMSSSQHRSIRTTA